MFNASVSRWPERTAIICGDTRWTFRALDAWATAIARGLVRMGFGPGHVVEIGRAHV